MTDSLPQVGTSDFSGFDVAPQDVVLDKQTQINIAGQGKPKVFYIQVKDRIRAMRAFHRDWEIDTELLKFHEADSQGSGFAVFRSKISVPMLVPDGGMDGAGVAVAAVLAQTDLDFDQKKELISLISAPTKCHIERVVIATAHASEYTTELKKGINFADLVQKCETTCIGRALALAGYGTDDTREFEVEQTREESGRYPGVDTGTTVKAEQPTTKVVSPASTAASSAKKTLVAKQDNLSVADWALAIHGFGSTEQKGYLDVFAVMGWCKEKQKTVPGIVTAFKDVLGLEGQVSPEEVAAALARYFSEPDRPSLQELLDGLAKE